MPSSPVLRLAAPPPLMFAGFLLAGYLIRFAWPVAFLPPGLNRIPALLLTLGGVIIFISALRSLSKARTSPNPTVPTAALVTTGAYLRTRNPIYLAFFWIYLGLACWMNSIWALALLPFLIASLLRGVILREEAYLEARFGAAYRDYKARVRRWM